MAYRDGLLGTRIEHQGSITQFQYFVPVESHVQVGFPGKILAFNISRSQAELYAFVTH